MWKCRCSVGADLHTAGGILGGISTCWSRCRGTAGMVYRVLEAVAPTTASGYTIRGAEPHGGKGRAPDGMGWFGGVRSPFVRFDCGFTFPW